MLIMLNQPCQRYGCLPAILQSLLVLYESCLSIGVNSLVRLVKNVQGKVCIAFDAVAASWKALVSVKHFDASAVLLLRI